MRGKNPRQKIIHLDGDKSNNKWENLHEGSRIFKGRFLGLIATNTSGVTGVRPARKGTRWEAYIGIGSKVQYLGTYSTKEEAVVARQIAEHRRERAKRWDRLK